MNSEVRKGAMEQNKAALGRIAASMAIFGTVGIFIKKLPFPSAVIALGRGIIGSLFLLLTAAVTKKPLDIPAIKKNFKLQSFIDRVLPDFRNKAPM